MIDSQDIITSHRNWLDDVEGGGLCARRATVRAFEKCREAVEEIHHQLRALGYPVGQTLTLSAEDLMHHVDTLEEELGLHLPVALVELWRHIGGISLVDLDNYSHVQFWKEQGITKEPCDGVVILPGDANWFHQTQEDYREHQAHADGTPFLLALSPDAYHKDNISGGACYGLYSGRLWRPALENFQWRGPVQSWISPTVDLMGYLRTALLECAGFPGLMGDAAFEPIRQRLLMRVELF